MHYTFHGYFRKAVVERKEFPLWCHYLGGGFPCYAHPEFPSLNPLSLWSLLLGELAGVKAVVLSYHLLGSVTIFWYVKRVLRWRLASAAAATFCYASATWLADKAWSGNVNELPIICLPVLAGLRVLYVRERRKPYIVAAAVALTWMLTDGKYSAPVAVLFLAADGALDSLCSRKRLIRNMTFVPAIVVIAAGLSAVKTYPMARFMSLLQGESQTRLDNRPGRDLFWRVPVQALFRQSVLPATSTVSAATSIWVGPVCLALAAAALLSAWRAHWRRGILWLLFAALQVGSIPFGLLHRLPVFSTMSVPQKYFSLPMIFVTSVLCGRFFSARWVRGRRPLRAAGWASLMLSMAVGGWIGMLRMRAVSSDDIPEMHPVDEFYQVSSVGVPARAQQPMLADPYFAMKRNVGVRSWYSSVKFWRHAIPRYLIDKQNRAAPVGIYRGEVYCRKEENVVRIVRRTGNRLLIDCRLKSPDRVVVNQNYHVSWTCNAGRVVHEKGLVAVDLERTGEYRIKFAFEPWDIRIGLVVTIVSAVLALYWCLPSHFKKRIRRRPQPRPERASGLS